MSFAEVLQRGLKAAYRPSLPAVIVMPARAWCRLIDCSAGGATQLVSSLLLLHSPDDWEEVPLQL